MSIARRWFPRPGNSGGRSRAPDRVLAINYSFVLHDASGSEAVLAAVRAARSGRTGCHTIIDGDTNINVDAYLVPSIGDTGDIASLIENHSPLVRIDRHDEPLRNVTFFRAPARLTLPDDDIRSVAVAALVNRPGGRSRQMIVRGPYSWPSDQQGALRALESLIQAHLDQWLPPAQLWSGPAEDLLADEVY
jgi:hypothetical protein